MTTLLPLRFPVVVPNGDFVLTSDASDGRVWTFDIDGDEGFKIVAPDRGAILAELISDDAFTIYFRFVNPYIHPAGSWTPPMVSVMRISITGISSRDIENEVAEQLFENFRTVNQGYIIMHRWIDRHQRLAWFQRDDPETEENESLFQVEEPDGTSRAPIFVSTFWDTPASGVDPAPRKPLLQVRRAHPLIYRFRGSIPIDARASIALIHEDQTARFYYDVPEFFDRLNENGMLLAGETSNFEFASRGTRPPQDYLKIFCVPAADAEDEAFESPTHFLVQVQGGHARTELTVPFRAPDGGAGDASQTVVVPPEIMRLGPDVRDIASGFYVVHDARVYNLPAPTPLRWDLFADSVIPSGLEAAFRPSAGMSGTNETLELRWEALRSEYSLEQLTATGNFVIAESNKYIAFTIAPNYLTLLQTRLATYAWERVRHLNTLWQTRSSPYRYKPIDALGLFTFFKAAVDYRGEDSNREAIRDAVDAATSGNAEYDWLDSQTREYQDIVNDLLLGDADDTIISIVRSPYFLEQLNAAPASKRIEVLTDLVLFLGSSDQGNKILEQLGAQHLFETRPPPTTPGMPDLFSFNNIKTAWTVLTNSREKGAHIIQYGALAHLRRSALTRMAAGGAAFTDAELDAIIENMRPKFRQLDFEIQGSAGNYTVHPTSETPSRLQSYMSRAAGTINVAFAVISLWNDYRKARSGWDYAGVALNSIDLVVETGSLWSSFASRSSGRASGAITTIAAPGRVVGRFPHASFGAGLAAATGTYNSITLFMEEAELAAKGDMGAAAATGVAAVGEGIIALGAVVSMTAAGAPLGLTLMAIGFVIALDARITRSAIQRTEVENVARHTVFGKNASDALSSYSPYRDIANNAPGQLRRVLSAVYPIEIQDSRFGRSIAITLKPTLAEFGSIVYLELMTNSETLVARFSTPLFNGDFEPDTTGFDFRDTAAYPADISGGSGGRHRTDYFQTQISKEDGRLVVDIQLNASFHPDLESVSKIYTYCTPRKGTHLPSATQTFSMDFPLTLEDGRPWLWPELSWVHERPDLTLIDLSSA